MAFCQLGKDYIKDGYTLVDNIFFTSYLPAADPVDCKVYLLGLYTAKECPECDNTAERLSLMLKLDEERVMTAFQRWEQAGLVSVSRSHPPQVTYHSVKSPLTPAVKINAREYDVFVEETARLFPEKILTPNEITSLIELMSFHKIEINAMLMIIRYCMDYKPGASVAYILAVASDWANRGIRTESEVNERIAELERNVEDIRSIFRTLGLKSEAGLIDRQLYLKWTKDYGYSMDAVLTAARAAKRRGGMERLSAIIEELKNASAHTAEEVSNYLKAKEDNLKLAATVVKTLGTYYASLDIMVETYLIPWQAMGFQGDALTTAAKFCFMRNVRTLDGMNNTVERFYKLGLLTGAAIEAYIARQVAADAAIKEVLEVAGSSAYVTNRDREFYRTFIEQWGFSHEVILAAAEKAAGRPFPMAYVNRCLAALKERNIKDVSEARNYFDVWERGEKQDNKPKSQHDYMQQTYTREQLRSVFIDIDDEGGSGK